MVKRTGPTNPHLKKLIRDLKRTSTKEKVNLWRSIAENLERSTRQRRSVNLVHIAKHAHSHETVIVPGKVLGTGSIPKEITVAAFQFSSSAQKKLGNKAISISSLLMQNPKGKNVRILG